MKRFALLFASEAQAEPATWYDLTGNYTASGDVLGYYDMTCASPLDWYGYPVYPMGTYLYVEDNYTGAGGTCVVTDTGDVLCSGTTAHCVAACDEPA